MTMKRRHTMVIITLLAVTLLVSSVAIYVLPTMKDKQDEVLFAVALQPLPNGEVKVLAKGSIGDVKRAKELESEWKQCLEKDGDALKSVPTPFVIYFKKNKIGVGSLKDGRLISKAEIGIEKLKVTPRRESNNSTAYGSECPKGFIQVSDRYCVATDDPIVHGNNVSTIIIWEWVPFMGVKVSTWSKPISAISLSWGLQLDRTAVAVYSLDIGGIPLAIRGNQYRGERLIVKYGPKGDGVQTNNGYVERYINLPVGYLVFTIKLRGYDRQSREYIYMPITGAYPLEILLTGEYNLNESDINKEIVLKEEPDGYLLTDHLIESYFPADAKDQVKVIKTVVLGYYANLVFQFQGGSSSDFYSFPVGRTAQKWLSSVGVNNSSISLIISYSPGATSAITYSINIIISPPNTEYEAWIKKRNVLLPLEAGSGKIEMYFTKITQIEGT